MRIMSTTNATENNQEQSNNTKEREKHENPEQEQHDQDTKQEYHTNHEHHEHQKQNEQSDLKSNNNVSHDNNHNHHEESDNNDSDYETMHDETRMVSYTKEFYKKNTSHIFRNGSPTNEASVEHTLFNRDTINQPHIQHKIREENSDVFTLMPNVNQHKSIITKV